MRFAGSLAILILSMNFSLAGERLPWTQTLRRKLLGLEHASTRQGRFGLYVKDLESGEELSYRGDETWYIASGVKVPIALEVLRQSDSDELDLKDRIRLTADDYVDGAGNTNSHAPGTELSVRYLLEQMLVHSDNTASDLLIRQVSLDKVNELMQAQVPRGFQPITRLSDVRRLIYSRIDAKAINLKGREFLLLKESSTDQHRLEKLGTLLGNSLPRTGLAQAYAEYYASRLNSATLRAYGSLLERTWEGKILSPASRALLLSFMEHAETGKDRVKAEFPSSFVFAHKTGTQRQRSCDFGLVRDQKRPSRKPIVVSACTEGFSNEHQGEAVLRAIGKALVESGVFTS